MLNTETLLNKMLEHFPKWMDIRKRATTSVGGQLLEAVAEETAALKETLEEFKKDFFIEAYFGKEEQVVDFVYKIQVGTINLSVLKIISHNLTYTDDLNVFYKQTGVFYYENGYLFFRIEDILTDKIEYTLNDFYFLETPERMHVWNIFDEFATFVGIERHEWENNKQLENRILNVFKAKTNNSKDGLAHAIFTELMELDPTLTLEEIKVEGVTPENLRKKYDDFSNVLEKLSSINKDCYKYKKWDVDPWYYSINSIDYIPHAWDIALEAFKDGIGKAEDLEIVLSSTTDTTDAAILLYKKNVSEMHSYLKKQNLDTNIKLQLTQFNEELKPIPSRYKITASKVADISTDDISFQYSDVSHVQSSYDIMDIIAKDDDGALITNDVQVNDYTLLPKNKKFKVQFVAPQGLKKLLIKNCDIAVGDSKTSLLKENIDFGFINNQFTYKYCKKYISKINDFDEVVNLQDTVKGVAIKTAAAEAKAVVALNDMGLERISFKYGCNLAPINQNNVMSQNFELIENKYVSYASSGDTKLEFEIEANSLKLTTDGECLISIYKDNVLMVNPFNHSGITTYQSATFKTSSKFKVEILSLNNLKMLKIYDLKYTNYEVEETLSQGNFSVDQIGTMLPNINKNELTIHMRSYFENAPYIQSIYIGAPYEASITYETEVFETNEDTHLYITKENLITNLIFVDEKNNEVPNSIYTKLDYTPYFEFEALNSSAYIELSLKHFTKINTITTEKGMIRTIFKDAVPVYIIELKKGDLISSVYIDGIAASGIKRFRLIDLFNVNLLNNDKLYVTNLVDGFIVEKNNVQSKVRLCDIEEIKNTFKYGMFNFINLPNSFNQNYIRDLDNDAIVVSTNGFNGSIKDATIKSKDKQTYIAYNEHKMIQQKKTMIQIEDTFNPFIPQQNLFYYEVTSMSPNINIQFHTFSEETYETIFTSLNWTIGKKYLCIEADFNILDSTYYLSQKIAINKKYTLQKTIPIDYITELDNGSNINICKYVIQAPSGITVNYVTVDPNVSPIEFSPEYYGLETMFKQYDGFNKLSYCNIDQILEFGVGTPDSEDHFLITSDMYTLLKEEGIIVWTENAPSLLDYSNIFIKYTIKIPNTLIVDDSILYEKTSNTIHGYSFVKQIDNLTKLNDGDFVDLSKDSAFVNSDRIVVQCTNPSFDGAVEKDGIRFKRTISDNALYARAGYYYIDGLEYYMFAQETSEKTDKVINAEFVNISKDDEGLHLQKASHNYINNSLLSTEGTGNVFSKNFTEDSNIKGASSLNAITACSSFNHWKNVGSQLSLVTGYNGVGIHVNPSITDGYAYIDISESLFENTLISLYRSGSIKAFIGKERKHGDLTYPNSDSIEILSEIKPSVANNNILSQVFKPDMTHRYYLVVKGSGVVDDIIICKEDVSTSWDYHSKNISTLGLNVSEQIVEDYTNRLFFYNTKGYKNLGAEINNDNLIVNSALINWGLTKIKDYTAYADWNYCELNNVNIENNMVASKGSAGYVMTEPIFTGDLAMLKSLTVKINDVEFEQTSGFVTTIYSCDSYYGIYEIKTSFKDNIGVVNENDIQRLGQYIKVKIEMPATKVVTTLSLFAEYKEAKTVSPIERINSNGQMLSEIYDGQYQAKYKLTDINIKSISNINDVDIQIRASRANKDENIWTEWKTVELNSDLNIQNNIVFDNYRFFQLKISLKRKDAYIQINYLDLKVVR